MPLIWFPPVDVRGEVIEPYTLRFDGLRPPGLNGDGGLIRMHRKARSELQNFWKVYVREAMPYGMLYDSRLPLQRCEIVYTVRGLREMDDDNLSASFKMLGDALAHNRIIANDSPRVITCFHKVQILVKRKKEAGCEVAIYPLP